MHRFDIDTIGLQCTLDILFSQDLLAHCAELPDFLAANSQKVPKKYQYHNFVQKNSLTFSELGRK